METKIEHRLAELIYQISSILFLIVGIVTNMISAIIYSKKKMRKTSYSVYLFALAIADLCVTINGNTRTVLMYFPFDKIWTKNSNQNITTYHNQFIVDSRATSQITNKLTFKGFDIRETSIVACRLQRFLSYYFLQFSSCLLCLLSIDRFFGIVLVLKAFQFNRASVARKIVLILVFLIALFNVHFLIFMGHSTASTHQIPNNHNQTSIEQIVVCDVYGQKVSEFYKKFWPIFFHFDAIIYTQIPFMIMIVCNACIVAKIIKSRVRSKQVIIDRTKRTSISTTTITNTTTTAALTMTTSNSTRSSSRSSGSSGDSSKILKNTSSMLATEKRISIILVSISFSFLVFTLPVFVVEHLQYFSIDPKVYTDDPNWEIYVALAYMMMQLNHVINFFFYCLIGPKFRSEVKKLWLNFCCCCIKDNAAIQRVHQSKSRNMITYPSTTFKKSPTQSNKQVTCVDADKTSQKKHLVTKSRTEYFFKKLYLKNVKVEQNEFVLAEYPMRIL